MAKASVHWKTRDNSPGREKTVLSARIILLLPESSVSTTNASSNKDYLTRFIPLYGYP
jgi:hypothetical protein